MDISKFVKEERGKMGVTQEGFSLMTGVGLRFIRELEQGRRPRSIMLTNRILGLFDAELGVVKKEKY